MENERPEVGSIVWTDLSVPDADEIRTFYESVIGWKSTPHDMGDYNDFNIVTPSSGKTVAGICHARGFNEKLPPVWLVYVQVEDVEASARRCVELGGEVLDGPRSMGDMSFCVIRDPSGAVLALLS